MSINEGLTSMRPVIEGFFHGGVLNPAVYGAFAHVVMATTDIRSPSLSAPSACATGYDSHKPEFQIWYFGLMLCEYVVGLVAKKCEEGHCNAHRVPPAWTACPKTRPVHLEMLRAFRGNLNALVTEIDGRIADLSKLPA
jgi:hypothetical protein